MEEIQAGEYVRTTDGDIFKVKDFYKSNKIFSMIGEDGLLYGNPRKTMKKHSFNIIDLIEVGDYVNGYKVLYNCKETEKEQCNGEYRKCIIVATGKTGEWKMVDWDLESIVTREQFKNMKYVVGDNQ